MARRPEKSPTAGDLFHGHCNLARQSSTLGWQPSKAHLRPLVSHFGSGFAEIGARSRIYRRQTRHGWRPANLDARSERVASAYSLPRSWRRTFSRRHAMAIRPPEFSDAETGAVENLPRQISRRLEKNRTLRYGSTP